MVALCGLVAAISPKKPADFQHQSAFVQLKVVRDLVPADDDQRLAVVGEPGDQA
jgi:hypothetical protein